MRCNLQQLFYGAFDKGVGNTANPTLLFMPSGVASRHFRKLFKLDLRGALQVPGLTFGNGSQPSLFYFNSRHSFTTKSFLKASKAVVRDACDPWGGAPSKSHSP